MREPAFAEPADVIMHGVGEPEHPPVLIEHQPRSARCLARVRLAFEVGNSDRISCAAVRVEGSSERYQPPALYDRTPVPVELRAAEEIFGASLAGQHVHEVESELLLAEGLSLLKAREVHRIPA